MRSIVKTRIGTVPIALVAVLALAAFISAGLWLVPNGQSAEAQATNPACPVAVADRDQIEPAGVPDLGSVGLACIVAAGTMDFDLELQGSMSSAKQTVHIYAKGGTISGGQTTSIHEPGSTGGTANDPTIAMVKSYRSVEISGADTSAISDTGTRKKMKVAVRPSGDMVTLYVYYGARAFETSIDHDGVDTTPLQPLLGQTTGASAATVTATVTPALNAPSKSRSMVTVGVPTVDGEMSKVTDVQADIMDEATRTLTGFTFEDAADDVNAAREAFADATTIVLRLADGGALPTGAGDDAPNIAEVTVMKDAENYYKAMGAFATVGVTGGSGRYTLTYDSVTSTGTIADGDTVTVTITYSRMLEGSVTFSVPAEGDVMLQSGFTKARTFTIPAKWARLEATDLTIVGLPKTGNMRVPLTVEYTGATGSLTGSTAITKYAMRTNSVPSMFSAMAYSCKQIADDAATTPADESETSCDAEAMKKASALKAVDSFAPGDWFLIIGEVKDSAGNPLTTSISASQLMPSGTTKAVKSIVNVSGMTDRKKVMIDSDMKQAKVGSYDIQVSHGALVQNVTIKVQGEATMFSLMAAGDDTELPDPDVIELGEFRRYVLKATDDAGNMPAGTNCVTIKLATQGLGDFDLLSTPAASSMCTSDDKTYLKDGMVTFSVDAPSSIPANADNNAQIRVRKGNSTVLRQNIRFGRPMGVALPNRAPTATAMPDGVTLMYGDMKNIGVGDLFSDADNDTLSIVDAYPDNPNVVGVEHTATRVILTGKMAGTAMVTVSADDPDGARATNTFTVTVEAMPDTTLGGAMNLMATPGDEQVTLSWTAGANADRHWIAGIKQSELDAGTRNDVIWTEAEGDESHTVTGLTNGEEYVFLVISGQTMNGVTTWYSSWSNRATATPMAAGSGGPSNPFG